MRFRKKKELTIIQRIEFEKRQDQERKRQLAADLLAPASEALEQLRHELKKSGYQVSKSNHFNVPFDEEHSSYYCSFEARKPGLLPVDFLAWVELQGDSPVGDVEVALTAWTSHGSKYILNKSIAEVPVWQIKQYFYEGIRSWLNDSRR